MAHKNEHIDWDVSDQERVSRAVCRKVRRRRRKFPALLLLLCLVLFCGGFILGQATEQAPAKSEDPAVVDGADQTDGGRSFGGRPGQRREQRRHGCLRHRFRDNRRRRRPGTGGA